MVTAKDELRDFARLRQTVFAEGLVVVTMAGALLLLAGDLDRVVPELKAAFFGVLLLFGSGVVRWVQRVVPVLAYRCPRCTRPFHAAQADGARPVVRVSACAHCGLSPRADAHSDTPTPG